MTQTGTFINKIEICGRIMTVRELNDDEVIVTLLVKDQRDTFPQVVCKKELMPEHKDRSYLEIEGYAEGFYKDFLSGKALIHRLNAASVRLAPTILEQEFGVKGRFWRRKECTLLVTGKLEDINEDGEYMRYIVMTELPDSHEMVPLRLDWRKIDRHPDFKKGDTICAACKINTPRKIVGTEDRIFLNFTVSDMNWLTDENCV